MFRSSIRDMNTRIVWRVRRIGRVDAFRPKGHGFDSRSKRHVETLGKSFTHSCLWRFGIKFRHTIYAVLRTPLSSSVLKEAPEKWLEMNERRNEYWQK